MKLSLISIAAVFALCDAQDDADHRKRPHKMGGSGGGGGGKLGDKLGDMIETKCSDPNTCFGVVPADLDCTFQEPEKPDTTGMDVDKRNQVKREYRAKKKECKENMVKCACCAGMSVEDIIAAKGDNGGSRPSGGGGGAGGRPGKGGDGFFGKESGGAKLQNMIETECDNPSTCDMVDDPTTLDCTFETPDLPDMSGVDGDAKAQLKEELEAAMKERYQSMAKCVCCAGMPFEDIMAATRPLGGGSGGKPGGRPGGKPGGKPGGMGGFGGGNRPQGGSEGMDIQAKLDEACSGDDVAQKCDEISSQAVDCSRFDSMMDNIESIMGSNIRGGRRKNVFYCGCCRDLP